MTAGERAARAAAADTLCHGAYDGAGGLETGVALVAVGGYGRGELAPFSDLDVVLVHDASTDPGGLADSLWYPLWDSGWRLDHSVRSMPEVVEAAADLKVALGLIDARHLAGDPGVTLRLRATMLADWRRQARSRLPELRRLVARRHALLGEVAHAAVPDLKEAEGGLRDAGVLKALEATWLVDASSASLEPARQSLLDVRDEVHRLAGRSTDRIAPEAWEPLGKALGLGSADAAQRHVRSLGRRVTHLSRLAWRRTDGVLARPAGERGRRTPALSRIAPGVALSRGEVVLDAGARPAEDPTLLLRAAAEASARDEVLAPATAARLVRDCPDLPVPWPAAARDALVRLLAGPGVLQVWETLEETGALDRFLPEWDAIRLSPHASVIHRFTVDRHVVETCREAGRLIRSVARPDLLLVASLLHDIGKGGVLDHSVAGEPIASAVATRMGFAEDDARQVARLVRHHLLLAELATTRDPDDPATLDALLVHVPDTATLALLRALTEADARATAPAAWTSWRATLVDRLVGRAEGRLAPTDDSLDASDPAAVSQPETLPDGVRRDPEAVSLALSPSPDGTQVTVVAADRVGLLADVAGALSGLGVRVRAARAWSHVEGETDWGCSVWEVADPHLDAAVLREQLRRVVDGARPRRRPPAQDLPPAVEVRPDASRLACVLEVRAGDDLGVVHTVLSALAGLDLTVRSAHVATLGPQAVDVFYVQEIGGVRPSEERMAGVAHGVRSALSRSGG